MCLYDRLSVYTSNNTASKATSSIVKNDIPASFAVLLNTPMLIIPMLARQPQTRPSLICRQIYMRSSRDRPTPCLRQEDIPLIFLQKTPARSSDDCSFQRRSLVFEDGAQDVGDTREALRFVGHECRPARVADGWASDVEDDSPGRPTTAGNGVWAHAICQGRIAEGCSPFAVEDFDHRRIPSFFRTFRVRDVRRLIQF